MSHDARAHFVTAEGVRVPAISCAERLEIDRIAVEQTGPARLMLMEHAGTELAMAAIELLRDRAADGSGAEWRRAKVIVLAGSGGNGAGGVCAARHLANRGLEVLVVAIRPPARAVDALGQQFMTLAEAPARVIRWDEAFDASEADLIIDAVIGGGLDGPPRAAQMGLIRAASASGVPVLSLDVPSGIDADSGDAPGVAVSATRTLALSLPAIGLREEHAGELWLADLGIPPGVFARAGLAFQSPFGAATRVPLRYPEQEA